MNLNPSSFDAAEEEELILKYPCEHFLQFYPQVIGGFPDFLCCPFQDHPVRYLIRIHYFYGEKGYLSII